MPDDLHDRLRRDAFRARISMAELIRGRLESPAGGRRRSKTPADPILKVAGICRGPVLSRHIDEPVDGD